VGLKSKLYDSLLAAIKQRRTWVNFVTKPNRKKLLLYTVYTGRSHEASDGHDQKQAIVSLRLF